MDVQNQLFLFQQERLNDIKEEGAVWELFVDGASRNNPGKAGAGVLLLKNGKEIVAKGFYLGIVSNNQAEYGALAIGIFFCKQLLAGSDELLIYSDSQLVVRQIRGEYRVKHPQLKEFYLCVHEHLKSLDYTIHHIAREKNSIADKLANKGIDSATPLPTGFKSFCSLI